MFVVPFYGLLGAAVFPEIVRCRNAERQLYLKRDFRFRDPHLTQTCKIMIFFQNTLSSSDEKKEPTCTIVENLNQTMLQV